MKKIILILILFSFFLLNDTSLKAQAWKPQGSGLLSRDGMFSISIIDSNTVWAIASDEWSLSVGGVPAGKDGVTILKTINGGQTWQSFFLAAPDTTGTGGVIGIMSYDLYAFGRDTAFLTTNDYNNRCALYMTTNGGEDWHKQYEDLSAGVWVRFFNRKEGVLIGGIHENYATSPPDGPFVSRTVDRGITWERIPLPQSNTFIQDNYESLQNACQVIGNTIWFITADGTLFRSRDKGAHWESFTTAIHTDEEMVIEIRSIAFSDTLNGLALLATENWVTHDRANHYYRTMDSGKTWTEFTPADPSMDFQTIVPVPGARNTFVGQGKHYSKVSAYSTDFGQNWTIIDNQYSYSCTSFLSPTIGWSSIFNDYAFYDQSTPTIFKWEGDLTLVNTESLPIVRPCEIYPNPFTDRITLTSPVRMERYNLYSMQGVLLKSGLLGASEADLDIVALASGMYLLEIRNADGTISMQKIATGY